MQTHTQINGLLTSKVSTEDLVYWNPVSSFEVLSHPSDEMPESPLPNEDNRLLWTNDLQETVASGNRPTHFEGCICIYVSNDAPADKLNNTLTINTYPSDCLGKILSFSSLTVIANNNYFCKN